MVITFPTNTTEIIDAIRNTIGRDIVIYRAISGIPCSAGCSLDPVTNLSTNQFCQTCNGNYWLNAISGVTCSAHVTWRGGDIPIWVPGGQIVDGDCRVQIKYTVAMMDHVDNAKYFLVDGREFVKQDISLRGVPEINRIIVTLVQKE